MLPTGACAGKACHGLNARLSPYADWPRASRSCCGSTRVPTRTGGLSRSDHSTVARSSGISPFLELHIEPEAGLAGGHAAVEVGTQIGRIVERGRRAVPGGLGHQLVLDVLLAEAVRQHAPVGGGQRRIDLLLHVLQDLGGLLVVGEPLLELTVQRGAGECAHLGGVVDEEDRVILQDEVVRPRLLVGLEQLRPVDVEQLDPHPQRAAQVRPSRLQVAREADPRAMDRARREHPDLKRGRQVCAHLEPPVRRAVQAQEHRARRGITTGGERTVLGESYEQPLESADRVTVAIAGRRGRSEIAAHGHHHLFSPGTVHEPAKPDNGRLRRSLWWSGDNTHYRPRPIRRRRPKLA
ncbi:hypothetical protein [Nannocystis pusilla]|uniref:hypothetical protein n=1 Tax=Nannocystis pusilla TaxID=889268 RepID=UPI003DA66CA7